MKSLIPLLAFALSITACVTVPDDERGQVFDYTGHTVTIRGAQTIDGTARPAAPTSAMVAQAKEVCPGAKFQSAKPSNTHPYDFAWLYLFTC